MDDFLSKSFYIISMDDFRLCMGMGRTGIEERSHRHKRSICNRRDLVDHKRAAQPDEADRPPICTHCSEFHHVRTRLQTSRCQVAGDGGIEPVKVGGVNLSASRRHS